MTIEWLPGRQTTMGYRIVTESPLEMIRGVPRNSTSPDGSHVGKRTKWPGGWDTVDSIHTVSPTVGGADCNRAKQKKIIRGGVGARAGRRLDEAGWRSRLRY